MSRVGVLSRPHNAVGNLATYFWLRQSFVAISFERCRYFLAHVACRNLPWQGLIIPIFELTCYVLFLIWRPDVVENTKTYKAPVTRI